LTFLINFVAMRVAGKIAEKIAEIPYGTTFTYGELPIASDEYSAAAKALERLVKKEVIRRASTGVFYKPRKSTFGPLRPREEELLRPYLFERGKRIAYITGLALYNRLGLTTQVPKDIRVASRDKRIVAKVGNIRIKPIKSYEDVTDDNYYLLELLDVLKDFKNISDMGKKEGVKFMLKKFERLPEKERDKLVAIALKYPPRVRAFVGSLLNELNPAKPVKALKDSLNPLSIFDFGIGKDLLRFVDFWNIR